MENFGSCWLRQANKVALFIFLIVKKKKKKPIEYSSERNTAGEITRSNLETSTGSLSWSGHQSYLFMGVQLINGDGIILAMSEWGNRERVLDLEAASILKYMFPLLLLRFNLFSRDERVRLFLWIRHGMWK